MVCFLLLGHLFAKPSREQLASLQFEQKLNALVPLGLLFTDENEREVTLRDLVTGNKPVILVGGYYECPMLCTLVLNGLVEALQRIKISAGKDFHVIFFSINPTETPQLAAAKKRAYVRLYGRPEDDGWHFLTSQKEGAICCSVRMRMRPSLPPRLDSNTCTIRPPGSMRIRADSLS